MVSQFHDRINNVNILKLCTKCCTCAQSLNPVQLFVTTWTAVCQAPLSLGFSRQEYWIGLPFPSPGDLPNLGIEPTFPISPALAGEWATKDTHTHTHTHTHTRTLKIWRKITLFTLANLEIYLLSPKNASSAITDKLISNHWLLVNGLVLYCVGQ